MTKLTRREEGMTKTDRIEAGDPRTRPTTGAHFTAVAFGPYGELDRYELEHAKTKRVVKGKVFLKKTLGLTSMEVSLNKLPPGAKIPFLHRHRAHEELYLFTSGRGEMIVDGEVIPVSEGSAVRVATDGARAIRSLGDSPLNFVCIQAKQGSLADAESGSDGVAVDGPVPWPS
jgi:mannose-6-phosphate isomerase-like protein (cupin superfamily)